VIRLLIELWRDDASRCPDIADQPPGDARRRSERGQSLIEYCILLTWTCLAMMALINAAGTNTEKAWSAANRDLVLANASAS
jgi:Flp pilus assembly pilin Flp